VCAHSVLRHPENVDYVANYHAASDGNASQGITMKSPHPDSYNAIGDSNIGQTVTLKRTYTNVGNS